MPKPGRGRAGLGAALPPPPLFPTALAVAAVAAAVAAAEEPDTHQPLSRPIRSRSCSRVGAMGAPRGPSHEDGGGGSGAAARARSVSPRGPGPHPGERGGPRPSAGRVQPRDLGSTAATGRAVEL